MPRRDTVWQDPALVDTFINEVRGGVPYAADQIAIMLRILRARGTPVERFADLGCGSGVAARAILAAFPGAQAVLVDFSEPMMEAARAGLAGVEPPPAFVVGDLAAAGWAEALRGHAPFDVIASSYAIHHLTDARKRALYGEVFDLLAPGGLFVNVEHVASATAWVEACADEMLVDSLYEFQQRKGAQKTRAQVAEEFAHRPDKAANILAPVERQCEWLRARGFADVDCFFKVFELAVFGGRKP